MISKIIDLNFHNSIFKKQTGQIFEKYLFEFPYEVYDLEIFDRVKLMTAENIHIYLYTFNGLNR